MIYFIRAILVYTTCFACTMMGAWIERHYGNDKKDTLWVYEWSAVVCGSLETQPIVSLCPMDIGGMDICDSDCQLIPHRHVADIRQFRYEL